MMKERIKSKELRIYRSLDTRKTLNSKEKQHYAGLEKGFAGEKIFDEWLAPVVNDRILLPDMQFMPNNNFFQGDSILITSKPIYLFEVKNYEGDHVFEGDNLYRTDGTIAKNPLLQLKRNETLLQSILKKLGYNIPIIPFAIFVNPRFHLYNAPRDLPIVYSSQQERFIDKLKQIPSILKKDHTQLSNQLIANTIPENPYAQIPEYQYEELRKGITCPTCGEFYLDYYRVLLCKQCEGSENAISAILRSLAEYKTLSKYYNLSSS
jgi:hypothetical protein